LIKDLESSIVWSSDASSVVELNNGDVACGTRQGDLTLWRIKSGHYELIKMIPCHTASIKCLEVLANGNVACNFWDSTIQIWHLESGVMLHRLCDDTSVSQMVLLSNGQLASLSWHGIVTVWNVEIGRRLKTFTLGSINISSSFIALPNERIATILASSPQNISIFNSNTGELAKSLIGHELDVKSLVLLNDTHMASSSKDRTIKIWDLARGGHLVRTFAGSINNSDVDLALLRDDVLVCYAFLVNDSSTPIQLWKWKTGEMWKTIVFNEGYLFFVKAFTKSPDDKQRLVCLSNLASSVEVLNDI
jgi:WD40 repeat protein